MTKILIEEATLDLALEALNTTESSWKSRAWEREQEAITAIKQVLEQPPTVQEPFGYVYEVYCLPECAWEMDWVESFDRCEPDAEDNIRNVIPLYTAPLAQPAPVQEPEHLQQGVDALVSAAGTALEVLEKHRQIKGEAPMGMLGVRAIEELKEAFGLLHPRDDYEPPEQPATEKYTALEQALTRLQKRYAELEAKVAAQPAPVQEPVAQSMIKALTHAVEIAEAKRPGTWDDLLQYRALLNTPPAPVPDIEKWLGQPSYHDGFGRSPDLWSLVQIKVAVTAMLHTPTAQPAVPDAITDSGENPKYRAGWNDCRQTMMEMMKARTL